MTKKQRKIFYPAIFILGLLLMAWQINIYRNTIIDLKILVEIIFIVGIIAFLVDFKNYKKTYNYNGIGLYLYSLLHFVCGFGFIVCSVFMLTNFYLAESESKKERFEIVERSSISGGKNLLFKRKPTFKINYKENLKELVFHHKYYDKMNFYTSVELEIRKGYFGFDILENKSLN